MKVFVAGGTGAVGRPLIALLHAAGHDVAVLTRSPERAALIGQSGAVPFVGDARTPGVVEDPLMRFRPEVVVHQLTTFPTSARPIKSMRQLRNTNRLRGETTRTIVDAARRANARRVIAQSIAFLYKPNPAPRHEDDPMITDGRGILGGIARGIADAERAVLHQDDIEGVTLRYGGWYGPGTQLPPDSPLRRLLRKRLVPAFAASTARFNTTYIDDAASAVLAALEGAQGSFNIVDSEPIAVADLVDVAADAVGARPPAFSATPVLRATGVYMRHLMLHQAAASNARARTELRWSPTHSTASAAIHDVFARQPERT